MSADVSLKHSFISFEPTQDQKSRRPRSCGLCELPIPDEQLVVLLTSGRSAHFECYIELHQPPPESRS